MPPDRTHVPGPITALKVAGSQLSCMLTRMPSGLACVDDSPAADAVPASADGAEGESGPLDSLGPVRSQATIKASGIQRAKRTLIGQTPSTGCQDAAALDCKGI